MKIGGKDALLLNPSPRAIGTYQYQGKYYFKIIGIPGVKFIENVNKIKNILLYEYNYQIVAVEKGIEEAVEEIENSTSF